MLYTTPWAYRPLDLPEDFWIEGDGNFITLNYPSMVDTVVACYSSAGVCWSEVEFDAWGWRLWDLLDGHLFLETIRVTQGVG